MPDTTPVTLLPGAPFDAPPDARTAVLRADAVASPFSRGGGCPCCAPGGGLTRGLRALLVPARRGEIDRVIVYTGTNDPAHALSLLRDDPVLRQVFHAAETP